jgi:hypothetical protein
VPHSTTQKVFDDLPDGQALRGRDDARHRLARPDSLVRARDQGGHVVRQDDPSLGRGPGQHGVVGLSGGGPHARPRRVLRVRDRRRCAGNGPFGFVVRSFEHSLSFTDSSADDFVEAELRHHPLWVGCRAVLERRGEWQAVRERVARICDAANEDSTGFRLTTHYAVTVAERPPRLSILPDPIARH